MSFSEVFVSRWPKRHILTVQPHWTGDGDIHDLDFELHKEASPAHMLQLTDQVGRWQGQFMWQGSFGSEGFESIENDVLKKCWRARHGGSYPFWMPSWKNDLTLVDDILEDDVTIKVAGRSFFSIYRRDCESRKGRSWFIPELVEKRWRWTLYGLLLIHDALDGDSGEEVRRFLPIGDPAVADDELTEGQNQGASALSPSGDDTIIKLRLMAGEELPAISKSQVRLLSLVRHVRFASAVQCSYMADYTPRISVGVSQIYDEAIFAPDLFAAFDYYQMDNPEGFAQYRQGRRIEGDADKSITVSLSSPSPVDGLEVFYTEEGDAEAGEHYEIIAGASPLVFDKGDTQKTITFRTTRGTEYFLERLLRLRLDIPKSSGLVKTTADSDEFRLYVAPDLGTNPPPDVEWTSSSSSYVGGAGGVHSGAVASVTASETQEDTPVWYEIDDSSTAEEGTDYEILLQPGERIIPSGEGAGNVTLPFTAVQAAGTGKTLKLNLKYERGSGEDQNNATYTERWLPEHHNDGPSNIPEKYGESEVKHVNYWPCGDNDGLWTYGPALTVKPGRPWAVRPIVDPLKKHPRHPNKPLEGFMHRLNAVSNGYIRHSSADELNCDGNIETFDLVNWQIWTMMVDKPSPEIAPDGLPRHIRMVLRDRGWKFEGGTDISHIVIFDSNSSDGGLLGAYVQTDIGRWGVTEVIHEGKDWLNKDEWESGTAYVVDDRLQHEDSTYVCTSAHTSGGSTEPGSGGSWQTVWDRIGQLHYGVDNVNGETRIWLAYNELDQMRITGIGSQEGLPSRNNRLFYHNNFAKYAQTDGDVSDNLGKGVLFYDQVHKRSSSSLITGPRPDYWPRPRSRWEPRGNAFLGTTTQHTITF